MSVPLEASGHAPRSASATSVVKSARNFGEQKSTATEYREKLTAMMKDAGVDPNDFEQVTSFLARGTPEKVILKIRMYNVAFLTQTLEGKHYQTPKEVFTSKRGSCNDFTSFNQHILSKAGISYTMYNTMEGGALKALGSMVGLSTIEGHMFIVAKAGDRMYRVDNLGTYYLGKTGSMSESDIVNLISYNINTLGPKNVWRNIERSDINTPRGVYEMLGLSKDEVNNAGKRHWDTASRLVFEKGKKPSFFGMRNDMGSVQDDKIDPSDLDIKGRDILNLGEAHSRTSLGSIAYYIISDKFLTIPKKEATPYDNPT